MALSTKKDEQGNITGITLDNPEIGNVSALKREIPVPGQGEVFFLGGTNQSDIKKDIGIRVGNTIKRLSHKRNNPLTVAQKLGFDPKKIRSFVGGDIIGSGLLSTDDSFNKLFEADVSGLSNSSRIWEARNQAAHNAINEFVSFAQTQNPMVGTGSTGGTREGGEGSNVGLTPEELLKKEQEAGRAPVLDAGAQPKQPSQETPQGGNPFFGIPSNISKQLSTKEQASAYNQAKENGKSDDEALKIALAQQETPADTITPPEQSTGDNVPFREGLTDEQKKSITDLINTGRLFNETDARNFAFAIGQTDPNQFIGKRGSDILKSLGEQADASTPFDIPDDISETDSDLFEKSQKDPTTEDDISKIIDDARKKFLEAQEPSDETVEARERLNELRNEFRTSQNIIEDQPIPMGFITGQQASVERRFRTAEANLLDELGLAQEADLARQKIAQAELGFAEFDINTKLKVQQLSEQKAERLFNQTQALSAEKREQLGLILNSLAGVNPDNLSTEQLAKLDSLAISAGLDSSLVRAGLQNSFIQQEIERLSNPITVTDANGVERDMVYDPATGTFVPSVGQTESDRIDGNFPQAFTPTFSTLGTGQVTGYGSNLWSAGLDFSVGHNGGVFSPFEFEVVATGHEASGHSGFGNQVVLKRTSDGQEFWFSHLNATTNAQPGDVLPAGSFIGTQGNSGAVIGRNGETLTDAQKRQGRGSHLDITAPALDGDGFLSPFEVARQFGIGGSVGQTDETIEFEDLSDLAKAVVNGTIELSKMTPTSREKIAPELDAFGYTSIITNETKQEINRINAGLSSVLELWKAVPDKYKGTVTARVGDVTKIAERNEQIQAFDTAKKFIGQQLARLVETGRLSDEDRKFYQGLMPSLNQESINVAQASADGLIQILERQLTSQIPRTKPNKTKSSFDPFNPAGSQLAPSEMSDEELINQQ